MPPVTNGPRSRSTRDRSATTTVGPLIASVPGFALIAIAHLVHHPEDDQRQGRQDHADPEHGHVADHQADTAHHEAGEADDDGCPGCGGVAVVVACVLSLTTAVLVAGVVVVLAGYGAPRVRRGSLRRRHSSAAVGRRRAPA